MATQVTVLFRVDFGYSPERGYAAIITRALDGKQRGIKGNSIRQLLRRVHEVIADEENRMRKFPVEQEESVIITPDKF